MKYNVFHIDLENHSSSTPTNSPIDNNISEALEEIEKEIIREYLMEQDGKIGIRALGNRIRYNEVLKSYFSVPLNKNVIIKVTENRRSFIKIFIDNWIEFNTLDIYFFVLENDFGLDSNLVDNSFIRLKEIEEELSRFFSFFQPKGNRPKIHVIEFKGFSDYLIEKFEGYSKIIKR